MKPFPFHRNQNTEVGLTQGTRAIMRGEHMPKLEADPPAPEPEEPEEDPPEGARIAHWRKLVR